MEVFKYLNKKMEQVTTNLIEQNDFIGYELGEEESQLNSDIDDLDDLDLFNEPNREDLTARRSEAEKINDSFANYFGLGDQHEVQKKKANEKMKQYQISKSRRGDKRDANHDGLDEFLGIGKHSGKSTVKIMFLNR
jgi:hypothetical protein